MTQRQDPLVPRAVDDWRPGEPSPQVIVPPVDLRAIGFRYCRSCEVTWHGEGGCWICS